MPKLDQEQFDALVVRVRAGDPEAAVELVKTYEPEIRREIRLRLTDPRLRRTLDSTDICQSVFGNFFVRASLGQIDFDRPGQLLRLLSTMARNKVIDRHRREKVRHPENGIVQPLNVEEFEPSDPTDSPSQIASAQELASQIQAKLTVEEQQVATMRREGFSWPEIGDRMNSSGEAIRKRLSRACSRILKELRLLDSSDEPHRDRD